MDLFYHIAGLCPTKNDMGGAGFSILLWPNFRSAVSESNLTQKEINHAVETMGRQWLDGCGYDQPFDPDNCGIDFDKNKKPGPQAGYLYEPRTSLRVSWGEWGPEHIQIPGSACGLDLSDGLGKPKNGKILLPHNVDTMRQAHLLLVVFLFFADTLVLNQQSKDYQWGGTKKL